MLRFFTQRFQVLLLEWHAAGDSGRTESRWTRFQRAGSRRARPTRDHSVPLNRILSGHTKIDLVDELHQSFYRDDFQADFLEDFSNGGRFSRFICFNLASWQTELPGSTGSGRSSFQLARAANEEDFRLIVGYHCQYCVHESTCPAEGHLRQGPTRNVLLSSGPIYPVSVVSKTSLKSPQRLPEPVVLCARSCIAFASMR